MSVYVNLSLILSLFTGLGLIFATYFNFKKLSDNIKQESKWRTTVDIKLEMIVADVKSIKGLEQAMMAMTSRVNILERDLSAAFTRLDELRSDLRVLQNNALST